MKVFLFVFLRLIFILALLPNVSVMAELTLPPHEDPAKAESAIDVYSLLTYYCDVFMQMSTRQYENASILIGRLQFAYVPEDLMYIIQRYNDLALELTGILNATENLLSEASTLLYQYRLEEASRILNDTVMLIGKARILLKEVEDATRTISSRLGVFAAPAESRVRQAYATLQSMLQGLRRLTEIYEELLRKSRRETSEIQKMELKPTEMTLRIDATSVFVGGSINANGNLSSKGKGLANRIVTILLDGSPLTGTLTSLDGSYFVAVTVPYRYVEKLRIEALYAPMGDDRGVYLASKSPTLVIDVMFYKTFVNVEAPSEAYPGLHITVKGNATVKDSVLAGSRNIKILLDHIFLAESQTSLQGYFEAQLILASHTPTGRHKLTVTVEPRTVYAGATYEGELSIVKAPSELVIQVPSIFVLATKMHLNGSVHSSFGPLRGALIRLEFGESLTIAKTFDDGGFNATLYLPLNLALSGFEELRLNVEPAEAWNAPLQVKRTVLVINLADISLVSAAFFSLVGMLYTGQSRGKPREEAMLVAAEIPSKLEGRIAEAPLLKPRVELEGVKGRILMAYLKAAGKIQEAVGISMEPHMTLREFLSESKPKLKGATGFFTELTFMAERILYSPYLPANDEALRAEGLAETTMEVLKSEAI